MEEIARVLSIRLVKNMTKNGKIPRFVALVAVGNGQGGLGLGKSRNGQAADAIFRATTMARKSMNHFEIFDNRTLYHESELKFKASTIKVRPAPLGIE